MEPSKKPRQLWSRDELLAALALYCQIPFGQMHKGNKSVGLLAEQLGRTPSAVALKLTNFASLDPEHQSRGISGMKNASKLDKNIWNEFYGDWSKLASSQIVMIHNDIDASCYETDSVALSISRRGQSFFRNSVLSAYQNKCCITGISAPQLIRASHIIPWSQNRSTRLDPRNGLALNALHDAAFDRGLVTLDKSLRLILRKCLIDYMPTDVFKKLFYDYEGRVISMPHRYTPSKTYMEHHREYVFKEFA